MQLRDGLTALHCAASRGHTECINVLINLCGAPIDLIGKFNLIRKLFDQKIFYIMKKLIELNKLNVTKTDTNGCTALHYAVTLGHADATYVLLDLGADPNRQDRKGRTPAHCGCAKGQFETVS